MLYNSFPLLHFINEFHISVSSTFHHRYIIQSDTLLDYYIYVMNRAKVSDNISSSKAKKNVVFKVIYSQFN